MTNINNNSIVDFKGLLKNPINQQKIEEFTKTHKEQIRSPNGREILIYLAKTPHAQTHNIALSILECRELNSLFWLKHIAYENNNYPLLDYLGAKKIEKLEDLNLNGGLPHLKVRFMYRFYQRLQQKNPFRKISTLLRECPTMATYENPSGISPISILAKNPNVNTAEIFHLLGCYGAIIDQEKLKSAISRCKNFDVSKEWFCMLLITSGTLINYTKLRELAKKANNHLFIYCLGRQALKAAAFVYHETRAKT